MGQPDGQAEAIAEAVRKYVENGVRYRKELRKLD
jgi:ribosomal protein S3